MDLAWDAPEDNCSGISSYTVQVQIDPSGGAQGGGGEEGGERGGGGWTQGASSAV